MATGPQVRERELAGRVGGGNLAVLGPDVDAREAAVARLLSAAAGAVDPHLPDRRPRLHRPGAAHLHPCDRLGRDDLGRCGLCARDRAHLGHQPRGRRQRDADVEAARGAGREWRHAHEHQLAPRHQDGVRAEGGALGIAPARGQRIRYADVVDRNDSGIPHNERVGDDLAHADLEGIGGEIERDGGAGGPDQSQQRRPDGQRRGVRRSEGPHVAGPHRVAHGGVHLKHDVNNPAVAGCERTQRPAEHRPGGSRRGHRTHVVEAGRQRVGQDRVGHGRAGRRVAIVQHVVHLLPRQGLGRTDELFRKRQERHQDAGLDGVGVRRVGYAARRVDRVTAVRHGARGTRVHRHLERHRAQGPSGHAAQVHDHDARARGNDRAGVVARGVGEGGAVPPEGAGHVGRACWDRIGELAARGRPAARRGVGNRVAQHITRHRGGPVHLLGEGQGDRRDGHVQPVPHRVTHGGIEPAHRAHRNGVGRAQHPGGAGDRDLRQQIRDAGIPQRDRPGKRRVGGVEQAVGVHVAIQRHGPSVTRHAGDGERIRTVPDVRESVREQDRGAGGPTRDSWRLDVRPRDLADEDVGRVGIGDEPRPARGIERGDRPGTDLRSRGGALSGDRRLRQTT